MDAATRVEQLRRALARYHSEATTAYDEVFDQVAERASTSGSLGKADIGALVVWKRLNASTKWARALMNTPDIEVHQHTARARTAALQGVGIEIAAGSARSALSSVPGFGVGDALASAVISALAPERMAVYDQRAQRGLEMVGLQLTPKPGRYGRYMALVEQILEESSGVPEINLARDVDLALFTLGASRGSR